MTNIINVENELTYEKILPNRDVFFQFLNELQSSIELFGKNSANY